MDDHEHSADVCMESLKESCSTLLKIRESIFKLRAALLVLWATSEVMALAADQGRWSPAEHAVWSIGSLVGLECTVQIGAYVLYRTSRKKIQHALALSSSVLETDAIIDEIFAHGFDPNDFR